LRIKNSLASSIVLWYSYGDGVLALVPLLEVVLSASTALGVAGVVPVIRKLFRKTTIDEITPEWLESFSVERYRPMLGLLAEEDFTFLVRQPGFDPKIYKKLRRDRLDIFDQYFSRLILDFKKLHLTARYMVARAPEDHSDVVVQLVRLRYAFAIAAFQVHFRYLLCRAGLGTLESKVLLVKLQQMSDHLAALSVPQAA
jgi:hypothetical protein